MSAYYDRLRAKGLEFDESGRPRAMARDSARTWAEMEERDETNKSVTQRKQMHDARRREAKARHEELDDEARAELFGELMEALISQTPPAEQREFIAAWRRKRTRGTSKALRPIRAVAQYIESAYMSDPDALITIVELLSTRELLVEHLLEDIERQRRTEIEAENERIRVRATNPSRVARDAADAAEWRAKARAFKIKYRIARAKGIKLKDPEGYLLSKE